MGKNIEHRDVSMQSTIPTVPGFFAYINNIRSIVAVLSSDVAVDFNVLYKRLSFLKDPNSWIWTKRILLSRGELELFRQLYVYKERIDWILYAEDVDRTNSTSRAHSAGTERDEMKLKRTRVKRTFPLPDEDRIHQDLIYLFERHLPGMKGEGLDNNFLSMRNILVGESKNQAEYETRFELFRSDHDTFVRYFCSWMKNIKF